MQARICSSNRLEMANKNAEPIISEIGKKKVIALFSCLPSLFCIKELCIKQCLKDHTRMHTPTHTHTQTRAAEINEKAVHSWLKLHEIGAFINNHKFLSHELGSERVSAVSSAEQANE